METEIDLSNVNRLYTIMLLESGERHGYQIIKDIEDLTGKKPSASHIYPFLSKLENKGIVESEEKGARGKKVYNLTDEGRKIVKEQVEAFGEILSSAIEGEITECSHCGCEIYSGGYEENGRVFCCEHCASNTEKED